jgi:prophage DNA circulation protein
MAVRIPILFQLNKLGIVGAQKELRKLQNQTKSFGLTSTLSIGAASAALAAYTKRSVAAAVADQKAQATLAQTLKNVGQAFATDSVTAYIDSLQRVTGVSEELLRPAFEKLVRAENGMEYRRRIRGTKIT